VHRSAINSAWLVLSLFISSAYAADPGVSAHAARLGPFDLEAHRGGRALRPENTLQSFANALSMGVDTLELDMGVTQDGVIVVSHERGLNPDLARGPDGKYISTGVPYVKLTLAEVKTYDVGQIRPGSEYAARFPDQLAIPGTRIPTLAEVFDLVRRSGDRHVRLNIETKIDPTQVQQPEENIYLDKSSPWTAGFDPMKYGGSVPRAVRAAGGKIWSPLYEDVTVSSIAEAHGLGLPVIVWTVNDPKDMSRLIDMGVDGIISDRPDLLRTVAASKGIPLPRAAPVTP